jgi:hypothetical protein
MNKKLFLEYFDVETDKEKKHLIVRKKGNGKEKYINPGDKRTLYFIFPENKPQNEEEADILVGEGKAIKSTAKELFFTFYDFTEEEWLLKTAGYDMRTHKYLEACQRNIGFLNRKDGWDGEKFDTTRQYEIWANLTGSGKVDCGQLKDGRCVAEYCFRTDIDDYNITDLYFNHMPSRREIKTAHLLNEIEMYFLFNPESYQFTCWECGREAHWLDNTSAKTLEEKFDAMKDQYCGC